MFGLDIQEITVYSILIAPIIAVIIAIIVERILKFYDKEESEKIKLYDSLVKTRRVKDSEEHNSALISVYNTYNKKFRLRICKNKQYKEILIALKSYADKKNKAPSNQEDEKVRIEHTEELRSLQDNFLTLLGKSVGKDFRSHEIDPLEIRTEDTDKRI